MHLCKMLVLVTVVSPLLMLGSGQAQIFTTLHSFAGSSTNVSGAYTNVEGAFPNGGLILNGKRLYGTAGAAGLSGGGTIFSFNTDGTSYLPLRSFATLTPSPEPYTNSEGAGPGKLIRADNSLYGATDFGGAGLFGTLFKVGDDASGFALLHSFSSDIPVATYQGGFFTIPTNADGAFPNGLVLSGTNVFGTAMYGGSFDSGTVFSLNTDGTGFAVLHNFTSLTTDLSGNYINADGSAPNAALVLSGTNLYGVAGEGGSFGNGTVFRINTDGTGFEVLHHFSAGRRNTGFTNSDGGFPTGLVLAGTTLYGTTDLGGDYASGTIFKLNTDGTGFTTLHSFSPLTGYADWNMTVWANTDGFDPYGSLTVSSDGGKLYGAAHSGGASGYGTIFSIKTDGTSFKVLHNFSPGGTNSSGVFTNSDGGNPVGDLALEGNTLYGAANIGGSFGNGALFSIVLTPSLKINRTPTHLVLSWPIDFPGFILQSSDTLDFPTWVTVPGALIVRGTNNVIDVPFPSGPQFYRLSQ